MQIDPSKQQPPLCEWEEEHINIGYVYYQPTGRDTCNGDSTGKFYCDATTSYIGKKCNDVWDSAPYPRSGFGMRYLYEVTCFHNALPTEGGRGEVYCPPLNEIVKLEATSDRVSESGKFSISWQALSAKSCTLSGKAPEIGNFSKNFSGSKDDQPTKDGDTNWPIKGSKTYDFVQRGIYTFKFECNGYLDNSKSTAQGTVTKTQTVFVGDILPAPKVNIKVEPTTIKKGESAILSWTSENAIAVSINQNLGVVGKTGSLKVLPSVTTRYAITGSGEFAELGLARASVSLRVVAADAVKIETAPEIIVPEEKPIETAPEVKSEVGLTVNGQKGTITVGVPANLSIVWKTDQYCIAYGSWLGIKNKAGVENRTLTKIGNYSYKLYCPGIGTEEVVVKAVTSGGGAGAVSLPVAEASVSLDGKNFTRSIRVIKGKKTHLWLGAANDVTGDRRFSRDDAGGWSSVLSGGGRCDWNYDLNRGIPVFDVGIADPKSAKDCLVDLGEVAFYDEPGVYTYGVLRLVQADGKVSNVSSINIAVIPPPPPDTPPVIDFRANGKENEIILGAPAEYDLIWDVKNADTCVASGSWTGAKLLSGMQKFVSSEKRELNHTLTCVGKLGTTVKNIFVKVAELPVCDFSALPLVLDKKSVFDRQSALTWKCQFANTCSIFPNVGTSVGTFGTTRVSPTQTTTYTLSCQNLEGSSSFDQLIEVR